MSGERPPSKIDPVQGLKVAFEKLSNDVKHLGMVLGVKENGTTQNTERTSPLKPKEIVKAEENPKNEFQKDMTQDEKKQQRAAKAAEKKARAEAAAAKKLAGDAPKAAKTGKSEKSETSVKKETVKTNTEAPKTENGNLKPQIPDATKDITDSITSSVSAITIGPSIVRKNAEKEVKSAMKPHGHKKNHHPNNGVNREVQFDLLANTTSIVKHSDSEEAVTSAIPEPPVVPLEDASSFSHIHPAFLTLSVRCEKELIGDLEQLCQEFIQGFREFLLDWHSNRSRDADPTLFGHDLDLAIRPQLAYLTQNGRWPLPYALGNLVRQLKREVQKMDGSPEWLNSSQDDLNKAQYEALEEWLEDAQRINFEPAYDAIALYLSPKIKNSRSIVTYDWCPVVNHVLLNSLEAYPDLKVCFVDPELNGKGVRHVNSFVEKGYRCQYTDLKSIGYVVQQSSMIVLGCSAVLSNGCVATTKGSLQIALTAKEFNVPVLILSQYFKFVDKVQSYSRMALLGRENIELVPSTLVTAIVTDIRILPPTAAPAVLKAKALDLN